MSKISKKFLAMALGAMAAHGDSFEVGVSTGVSMNSGGQVKTSISNPYDVTKHYSRGMVERHFRWNLTDQEIDALKQQARAGADKGSFAYMAWQAVMRAFVGSGNQDLLTATTYTRNQKKRAQNMESSLVRGVRTVETPEELRRLMDIQRDQVLKAVTSAKLRAAGIGVIAARHAIDGLDQKDQKNPENEFYPGTAFVYKPLKGAVGVPVHVKMGYVFNLGPRWFAGPYGVLGVMGGSASSAINVQVDKQTVKAPISTNVPDFLLQGKMVVSPGLNMGLGAKLGYNFDFMRMFFTSGWTVARMKATFRVKEDGHDNKETQTQTQWKNGLFVGGGVDYNLSETIRVGLSYTATFFGKAKWKQLEDMTTSRLVNHNIGLGVTYVVPSES